MTGMDDMGFGLIEYLAQNNPQQLAEMMGLGTMDERSARLEQQMAMADALAQPSSVQRSTGWGAALQGIGDIGGAIMGGLRGSEARKQQQALLDEKDRRRGMLPKTIGEWMQHRANALAAPDLRGGAPVSLMPQAPRPKPRPAAIVPPVPVAPPAPKPQTRAPWEPVDPYYAGY